MIAVMKAHFDSFGGVTLAVDAWKNIEKQSLFGQKLMCAKDYLLFDMKDVTSKTHNAKFMVEKIYEIIDEIKEKYGCCYCRCSRWSWECCKAWRLIAGDVDRNHPILIWCNAHLFNLLLGDLFHRTKSKGSCYEICTILCDGINWFNNHPVALGLLKLEQREINGKESSLCTTGATRWNSVCYAAKSFQKSNKPIRSLILTKIDILE